MSSPPNAKRIKTSVSNPTASNPHIQQLSPSVGLTVDNSLSLMSLPAGVARTNPRKRRSSPPPIQPPVNIMAAPPTLPIAPISDPDLNPLTANPVSPDSGTPKKKGRTNIPWTPQEEQRLKVLRDNGSSWSEIAKAFPNRTEGSVKKHWYKDMHYAEFAEDESKALLAAIKEYDANKWKVIGQKVGKPAKACEQYAKEHFKDL